ncbi:DUF3300 domain-containing protein [Paludibaculum fermentans]|uniref:DUF3300 domain-containing protein n=1 Tax=Paludibaculum fermentans TaxID=1473598 RepID=A0A7S7NXU1_PALFE|nr:DUF3300 domain-containing protein [Paludibaculum fermentans]QOY91768.1 DUF3300 domain-containing protein [Paludibaculum fermentans]
MSSLWSRTATQRTVAALFALLVALPVSYAQEPADSASAPPPDVQQSVPQLSQQQLSNLVAPIALYPDPLLSQVLAASTYPLEIVEAHQWLAENKNLSGSQLIDAAKQQNWDPSVQALVAFPDALGLLANDIRWTTDLGNAFLAQQADVMGAVQDLRSRARANGKLTNSQQQVVTTESQDGQNVIQIMPADPQVIYVPVYQPNYVWGAPAYGYYPDLWYPSWFSFGYGWGPGLYMSSYYPSWGGWGGWGWNCGWFGRGISLNFSFFNHYGYRGYDYGGYRGYYGRGYSGSAAWAHNPGHRWGVAYPNRNVASRFSGGGYSNGGRGNYGSGFANGGRNNYGSRYDSPRNGGSQYNGNNGGNRGWRSSGDNNRGGGGRENATGRSSNANGGNNGGWRSFGDGNRGQQGGRSNFGTNSRGDSGSPRMSSPNSSNFGGTRGGGSEMQSGRGFSSSQGSWSTRSNERSGGSSYSAPRSGGSNGGGFSSPRSAPAQRQNFSSGSSSGSFSSPRSFGGGGSSSGGFSAPSRGFGGGGGFSGGGRSSGGGGFSGGGGGRSSGGFSGGGGGHSGGGGGGGHRGR